MKTPLLLCVAALAAFASGCGNQSSETSQTTSATSAKTNVPPKSSLTPVNAPSSYAGALGRAQTLAAKTADLSSVTEAIRMFHVEKGRFPKTLNELVQDKYLPRLPAAPAGTKYSYDPNTGQVKVVAQ